MWPFSSSASTPRVTIAASDLHTSLKEQLGARMASHCTIRLADASFATVTGEEARQFVASAASYWTPQINDCDDQAWMAKAADHALNWYLDPLRRIKLIDQPGASTRLTEITLILA